MENLPQCILVEVESYLSIKEVSQLAQCNKSLSEHVSQNLHLVLSLYLSVPPKLKTSLDTLKAAYLGLKDRKLLKFAPLFTDGGVSEIEYMNFFSSMWAYNGMNYSTHYSEGSTNTLKPVNCVGYFEGGYQDDNFFATYHHDEMNWRVNFRNIPLRYNLPLEEVSSYRNTDPIYRRERDYDNRLNLPNFEPTPVEVDGKMIRYPLNASKELAVVSEVGIARPLFYTGSVKTLCVFFSSVMADFSAPYSVPFGFENFETARERPHKLREHEDSQVKFIEYSQDPTVEFYPVLWIQFKDFRVNNITHTLHRPMSCVRVLVHLINIDDRREEYNLQRMEPNFDLTYCVMIGSTIAT